MPRSVQNTSRSFKERRSAATRGGTGTNAFSPLSISGLVGWWDLSDTATLWADAARTTPSSADGVVLGVTDKSGAGRHLSEATNGPTRKDSIQNGRTVLRYDGINDQLKATGFTADQTFTCFVAAIKATVPDASPRLLMNFGGTAQLITLAGFDATKYVYYSNQGGGGTPTTGVPTSWNVAGMRFNSTASLDVYFNGGAATNLDPANGAAGDYDISTVVSLGASASGDGWGDYDIGEALRYSDALSASDVNRVGVYLAKRWGTSWTPVP